MMQAVKLFLIFVAVLNFSLVSAIVGGKFAAIPPYNDPVVFINHVGRFSRVEGYHDPRTGLYSFRGIKYAEPPIRENRFLRPRMKRLSGDINAKLNAPPCPQPDFYDENKIIGDEDCLALNIFTPQMPDETTGLPVLLWIHGGGFRYGSAAQYGAEPLVQNNVIFVPIQYRLGTLGILGDGSKEFSGNVGLFDMHAALQWIKEYISFFGGDPNQVKVIGHGSGAQSGMYLSSSPMGRSLVNGVVAMSGSSLSQFSYDENATTTTEQIAAAHKCEHKNEIELINCLRSKSFEDIVKKDSEIQVDRLIGRNMMKAMNGLLSFAPCIESENDRRSLPGFVTEKPEASLKQEPEKKIPLLIGVTKHETASGINTNEVLKIFKSGTEFLKSASKTLHIGFLLNSSKPATDILGGLGLPSLDDYLTVPNDINPEKLLSKLIETTTDVFFNVPSVLTAGLWGKWSKAFFYQFDYVGTGEPSGKMFLRPLPLVSKQDSKDHCSHGDELGFLFDAFDVFGRKINASQVKSEKDIKVSKNFMNVITRFAYMNSSHNEMTLSGQVVAPFNVEGSNFIDISKDISFKKDFRFCQMSLLGAPLKASQKITCDVLSKGLTKLPTIPKPKDIGGLLGSKKTGIL